MNTERRYDIDWLRVISIGLLIIYHTTIGFQPWGVFIRFIQNEQTMENLWIPMSMLNIWRIPLLFLVSGMGVCYAMQRRNWKQLILERGRRIMVPFVFGAVVIVPVQFIFWLLYYNQDVGYFISRGHLWFLLNIFLYVVLLLPVFLYLKSKQNGRINKWFLKQLSNPIALLFIAIPFILEALAFNPEMYTMYAFTWHGFVLGLLAFFFGFVFILNGKTFWQTVLKGRWFYLAFASTLYVIRMFILKEVTPIYLIPVETVVWILGVLGFGYKYLNKPSKALSYLSQAAYPIYILHMLFIYLGSYLVFPIEMTAIVKFLMVNLIAFAGCFLLYEFGIRRVSFIRPLFGLKSKYSQKNTISDEKNSIDHTVFDKTLQRN